VSVHKCYFHRKDAKNAEKFLNEDNKTLRILCVEFIHLWMNTYYNEIISCISVCYRGHWITDENFRQV
jgi:hypothetical protein